MNHDWVEWTHNYCVKKDVSSDTYYFYILFYFYFIDIVLSRYSEK